MERYKNLDGNSDIVGYEITESTVTVQFSDGAMYLYTAQSTGAGNLNEMRRLAVAGRGLNSFINRTVRKDYAWKSRQPMRGLTHRSK